MLKIRFLTFSIVMLCPALIFANDTITPSKTSAQTSVGALGAGAMISQVVVALAVVTALILVLAWCVKRLGGGAMLQQRGMKLTSVLPVGAREKVVLLEVENKKLLIGVASGHVSFLYAFDDASALNPANVSDRGTAVSKPSASASPSVEHGLTSESSSSPDSSDNAIAPGLVPSMPDKRSPQAFIFGDSSEKWDFSSTLKKLLKEGERR